VERFEVWPDHWHALQVFLGMGSQWRIVGGMAGLLYQGLDYGALEPVLRAHKRGPHRQPMKRLMPQLRRLEAAAADVLNQQR